MKNAGIIPNAVVYTAIINAYGKVGNFARAEHFYEEAEKSKLVDLSELYIPLVQMYEKLGQHGKCRRFLFLMEQGKDKSERVITTLIDTWSKLGNPERVDIAFKKNWSNAGIERINAMLAHYSAQGQLKQAEELYRSIPLYKKIPTGRTFTILIQMYGKFGQPKKAERVFYELLHQGKKPSVVTFTALLNMYIQLEDQKNAERVFRMMKEMDVRPDNVPYNILIKMYGSFSGILGGESGKREPATASQIPFDAKAAESGNRYEKIYIQNSENLFSQSLSEESCLYRMKRLYHDSVEDGVTLDQFTYTVLSRVFRKLEEPGLLKEVQKFLGENEGTLLFPLVLHVPLPPFFFPKFFWFAGSIFFTSFFDYFFSRFL